MKSGFTLMELLFVIVIVSVISISSVVVFGNIDDSTAQKDRVNTYTDIQRAAVLYIDLNDYWLAQFKENKEIKIELSELKTSNYIDIDVQDPVSNTEIPSNYMVQIYTATDPYGNEYIDTCIVSKPELLAARCNPSSSSYNKAECEIKACVADSKGKKEIYVEEKMVNGKKEKVRTGVSCCSKKEIIY